MALLQFFGFIALLLWGTHMVQTGVQRAFGAGLERFLKRALRNRISAFVAGVAVAAGLQSSTATALIVSNLASRNVVPLISALAVMLGANVGTTLVVQIITLDIEVIAAVAVLVGVVMFKYNRTSSVHDLGRAFIGFGLLQLSLSHFQVLVTSIAQSGDLRIIVVILSSSPIILLIATAGVTWLAHSSVAVVVLVAQLVASGVVTLEAAFAMVLGANLGTAINPLIEGAAWRDLAAKRVPVGNLVNRVCGIVACLAFLHLILAGFRDAGVTDPRAIVLFHTLFNVGAAVCSLPLLSPLAAALKAILPEKIEENDPKRARYLDASSRETPVVALGNAAREALRLSDVLDSMLQGVGEALRKGDRRTIATTSDLDDILDSLNSAIREYVTSLDAHELDESERRRLREIILFSMNIEQAGDVVDRNLLPHIAKRVRFGITFSTEDETEIASLIDRLCGNLRMAAALFMADDVKSARALALEKTEFRERQEEAIKVHIERLQSEPTGAVGSGALHLDILHDLKRVNAHIVAAAAYPVLEKIGDLLPSRLASSSGG